MLWKRQRRVPHEGLPTPSAQSFIVGLGEYCTTARTSDKEDSCPVAESTVSFDHVPAF